MGEMVVSWLPDFWKELPMICFIILAPPEAPGKFTENGSRLNPETEPKSSGQRLDPLASELVASSKDIG